MKKTILFFAAVLLLSCSHSSKKFVVCSSDKWDYLSVECDSFDMISTSHVVCWGDGRKFNVFGNNLIVR